MSESDGKQPNKTLAECLAATLDKEGVDISLMTGLDLLRLGQYGRLRKQLSEKYPKLSDQREDEDDTVNVVEAKNDARVPLFTRLMFTVKESFDRVETLQAFATEYDRKVVRFYAHITLNWLNQGREWLKLLGGVGIFEMVEAYFKVLRKYGLSTEEEPYYFLSPEQKQNVKYAGDVLKRTTMMDENEIKLSVLEGLE